MECGGIIMIQYGKQFINLENYLFTKLFILAIYLTIIYLTIIYLTII